MPESITEQLATLDYECEQAARRAGLARDERRRRSHQAFGVEAVSELSDYCVAVSFRQRAGDREEHRRLTLELLDKIRDEDLVLDSVGRGALQVVDPTINEELDAAEAAVIEARRARKAFAAEHADAIEAERKAAEMGALRAAIEGDDPDAVKAALGTGPARNILTSAD